MRRTGKCIQMLCVLGDGKMVSAEKLAEILNTNPRNIREFRKELEEAGFQFYCKHGRYGGLQLLNKRIEIHDI